MGKINCLFCGKVFTNYQFLEWHMNRHTTERPYECDLCSEWFGYPGSLHNHKKTTHGVMGKVKHKCQLCHQVLRKKADLQIHKCATKTNDAGGDTDAPRGKKRTKSGAGKIETKRKRVLATSKRTVHSSTERSRVKKRLEGTTGPPKKMGRKRRRRIESGTKAKCKSGRKEIVDDNEGGKENDQKDRGRPTEKSRKRGSKEKNSGNIKLESAGQLMSLLQSLDKVKSMRRERDIFIERKVEVEERKGSSEPGEVEQPVENVLESVRTDIVQLSSVINEDNHEKNQLNPCHKEEEQDNECENDKDRSVSSVDKKESKLELLAYTPMEPSVSFTNITSNIMEQQVVMDGGTTATAKKRGRGRPPRVRKVKSTGSTKLPQAKASLSLTASPNEPIKQHKLPCSEPCLPSATSSQEQLILPSEPSLMMHRMTLEEVLSTPLQQESRETPLRDSIVPGSAGETIAETQNAYESQKPSTVSEAGICTDSKPGPETKPKSTSTHHNPSTHKYCVNNSRPDSNVVCTKPPPVRIKVLPDSDPRVVERRNRYPPVAEPEKQIHLLPFFPEKFSNYFFETAEGIQMPLWNFHEFHNNLFPYPGQYPTQPTLSVTGSQKTTLETPVVTEKTRKNTLRPPNVPSKNLRPPPVTKKQPVSNPSVRLPRKGPAKKRASVKKSVSVSKKRRSQSALTCPFCKRTFPFKSVLMRHVRSHTGEKPFACPGCDQRFAVKGNLKLHSKKCCPVEQ